MPLFYWFQNEIRNTIVMFEFGRSEDTVDIEGSFSQDDVSLNTFAKRYFRRLLEQNITTFSAETNMMTKLDQGRKGMFNWL